MAQLDSGLLAMKLEELADYFLLLYFFSRVLNKPNLNKTMRVEPEQSSPAQVFKKVLFNQEMQSKMLLVNFVCVCVCVCARA